MDIYGEILSSILPDDWELDGIGDGSVLICPHGEMIEPDGWHTDDDGKRCESPLLTMGMI